MANQSIGEDQEALFQSSPCALYYVQSPSTTSHANSHPSESTFLSPFPNDNASHEVSRLNLSRYSSSRGSNNSYLHEKKLAYGLHSQSGHFKGNGRQLLRIINDEEGEDGEGARARRRHGLWRFLSVDPSSSCCCVAFQVIWRLVASMGIALLVFYLATRPPAPKVSFKIAAVKQFDLGEGIDSTGVATKILTCNCSIDMEINNYSKVFGLHVHPPAMGLAFGRLNFASSQGEESYIGSQTSISLRQYIAAKNKPVYGAGMSMQDMLDSGRGLPLVIKVRSKSSYRVVGNLIRPRYHHNAECLLVLDGSHDKKRRTEIYSNSCSFTTSHA